MQKNCYFSIKICFSVKLLSLIHIYIHQRLGLTKGQYILLSAHREENIDTDRNFVQLFTACLLYTSSPAVCVKSIIWKIRKSSSG